MTALHQTLETIKDYYYKRGEFPSPEWLSMEMSLKLHTIKSRIRELAKEGYIRIKKGFIIISLPERRQWMSVSILSSAS